MDLMKENFEQTIQNYIFSDISVDELASKCNRSLTSFKKEFRKHFYEPPHKWFIRQRLMHSRLLLISTNKSISEIGNECTFPNTSHFIKLFKKEYGMTPSHYRHRHMEGSSAETVNSTIERYTSATKPERLNRTGFDTPPNYPTIYKKFISNSYRIF